MQEDLPRIFLIFHLWPGLLDSSQLAASHTARKPSIQYTIRQLRWQRSSVRPSTKTHKHKRRAFVLILIRAHYTQKGSCYQMGMGDRPPRNRMQSKRGDDGERW
jgi:hypothetical protein